MLNVELPLDVASMYVVVRDSLLFFAVSCCVQTLCIPVNSLLGLSVPQVRGSTVLAKLSKVSSSMEISTDVPRL